MTSSTAKAEIKIARRMFTAGERVCCAVSGGADSVAMLLALREANTEGPQNKLPLGVVLSVLHVHHGLRGVEADGDEGFVRELCTQIGVPLHVERVDTAARQATEREGLEEAARHLRYAVFRDLLRAGRADSLATAHTLDDQAETVMMKLLRGAWTEGLGGVSPVVQEQGRGPRATSQHVGRIVRPMLGVRRAEVEAFLRKRGQAWREDSSNADVSFTRNRVRHELMPLLRSFNPEVDALLANVAEIARDEQAHWELEMQGLLPKLLLPGKPVRGGGRAVSTAVDSESYAIELEPLKIMDAASRRRALRAAAQRLGFRLNFAETASLLALAGLGFAEGVAAKPGGRLELRGGLRAERSVRELQLSRQAKDAQIDE